jgi:N-acetyl-gamma-glutamyl-phosphate reductase
VGSASRTAAIVGASGYAGQVLVDLLSRHPCLLPWLVDARVPEEASRSDLDRLASCDVVALAVPEDAARTWATTLLEGGARRVIDLSGAHRQTAGVHYGLPELFGPPPGGARLVANPGCYPAAVLLALGPLVEKDLVARHGIAVVGASGASGAGKGLRDDLHFCNLEGNMFPYQVGRHRHAPEIEHHLGAPVSFVTELLPISRGILVTAFVRPSVAAGALREELRSAHADHPYVSVLREPGQGLGLRHVVGTHQAVLAVGPEERSGLVPVFAAIDNLMRGAASQALFNVNAWLGLDPSLGLPPPARGVPAGPPSMRALA